MCYIHLFYNVYMYLNLSYNFLICLFVKHKVKWMVKVVKTKSLPLTNLPLPPHSQVDSLLHLVFTLFANILKQVFEQTKI